MASSSSIDRELEMEKAELEVAMLVRLGIFLA
jgi:hypothetical protein